MGGRGRVAEGRSEMRGTGQMPRLLGTGTPSEDCQILKIEMCLDAFSHSDVPAHTEPVASGANL